MKKGVILSAVLAAAAFTAPAYAIDKGDWIFRAGATGVFPESTDSDDVEIGGAPVAGTAVGADDAWSLGLTFGYAVTDNVVIELLAAWPFSHDIEGNGALKTALSDNRDIGEIDMLPPTLSVQYHFMPKNNIRPFVSGGVTWFIPFDEDPSGPLKDAGYNNLDVDDAFGFAVQAGVDFDVTEDWFITADVRYMMLETDATVKGPGLATIKVDDITLDPWVYSIMLGTRF